MRPVYIGSPQICTLLTSQEHSVGDRPSELLGNIEITLHSLPFQVNLSRKEVLRCNKMDRAKVS